jgi:hypothetical protein
LCTIAEVSLPSVLIKRFQLHPTEWNNFAASICPSLYSGKKAKGKAEERERIDKLLKNGPIVWTALGKTIGGLEDLKAFILQKYGFAFDLPPKSIEDICGENMKISQKEFDRKVEENEKVVSYCFLT